MQQAGMEEEGPAKGGGDEHDETGSLTTLCGWFIRKLIAALGLAESFQVWCILSVEEDKRSVSMQPLTGKQANVSFCHVLLTWPCQRYHVYQRDSGSISRMFQCGQGSVQTPEQATKERQVLYALQCCIIQ